MRPNGVVCFYAGSVWSTVDKNCQVGGQPICSAGQELCQTVFQTQGKTLHAALARMLQHIEHIENLPPFNWSSI